MYIWNLIITAPCCFPVNCIVSKVVENSYSMLYQHSNIIESGGVGEGDRGDVPNWTILRKYEASLYYLFYISWYIRKNQIIDIKKSNSWYQEIGLIFYIKKSDWFIYIIDFFHIKKWIFLISKIDFKNLISRNTEWIIKRHFSAPFYYLFDNFLNSWYKKTSIWVFDIKYQLDFLNHEFDFFLYNFLLHKKN